MARKTKLTDNKIKEVCNHVSSGMPIRSACILSNISEPLYYGWKNKGSEEEKRIENGEKPRKEYAMFLKFLKHARFAEENYVKRNIDLVNDAAQKDASYAKWLLQVKKPDDFGTKTQLEITNKFEEMKKAVLDFGKDEEIKE